ncbi:MAG: hypothetical protein JXA00_01200 [Candidatus Thermoplasmatota archaeon]|nr:hypothetical protein [Candidatus Thermoplasmatota archaeon]
MKTQLMNYAIAMLVIISMLSIPAIAKNQPTPQTMLVDISCDDSKMTVYPNENAVFILHVKNIGSLPDSYKLTCPDAIDGYYYYSLTEDMIKLYPGETKVVVLTVTPYKNLKIGHVLTVKATSTSYPLLCDSAPTYTRVIVTNRTIDTATDKAVYMSGETALLSIKNIGTHPLTGNPGFYLYDSNHVLIGIIVPDVIITLNPGEVFTSGWTLDGPPGKYCIEGHFVTLEATFTDCAYIVLL